jgi:hypothetical protein
VPSSTLQALLAELIDYAGLFPPAHLPMDEVVSNHAQYMRSRDTWALGRLVVPVVRLGELRSAIARDESRFDDVVRVSALGSGDVERDGDLIRDWNASGAGGVIDAVELRVADVDAVARAARAIGGDVVVYAEFPAEEFAAYLPALARAGVRAKIRTGGVTPDAFPSATTVARFLLACAQHDVPFKATAGLHHPLRAEYRLTYEDDAPRGVMFGFLNVFLAAAFARTGLTESLVAELLEERDATAVVLGSEHIAWRDHSITLHDLSHIRRDFAIAFGSCSFREPIDDLHRLGLL